MTTATKVGEKFERARMGFRLANDQALGWMDAQIKAHQDVVESLKLRRGQFQQTMMDTYSGNPSGATPIEVLAWFVNDGRNLHANLRPDQAVNIAATVVSSQNALHHVREDMNRE